MYVNSATFTEVLCKYVHFPKRYGRKQGDVFFLETQCKLQSANKQNSIQLTQNNMRFVQPGGVNCGTESGV